MSNGLTELEKLHTRSTEIVKEFENLPEKDIRRKHLEILSSQILVALFNLKFNLRFTELDKKEFESYFNDDKEQAENYIYNIIQTMNDSIADTALFQTELIFRFIYSNLKGINVADEKNLFRIIATLYNDVENNWQKDESKIVILLWTFRNTVHTGGIYFHKPEGYVLQYKGQDYKFEYGKSPEFLKGGHFLDLVSDLLESLKYVFSNDPIKSMASVDHPSYKALGY